jgi:hypothetical protein
MTTPTDRPDPGLPEAVQRVAEILLRDYDSEHNASHLNWHDFDEQAERLARAARADYPDVVRNAKAEVLDWAATSVSTELADLASQGMYVRIPDLVSDLHGIASAIREGRTDGE